MNQDSRSSVKEVVDFMVDLGKTVISGPTDADRPQPYIGPGYETHTDLMAAGISEEDVEHFELRPKTKAMILEQIQSCGRAEL